MEQSEHREVYETALTKWGVENQLWMVIEECGELLNAIGKMRRESYEGRRNNRTCGRNYHV